MAPGSGRSAETFPPDSHFPFGQPRFRLAWRAGSGMLHHGAVVYGKRPEIRQSAQGLGMSEGTVGIPAMLYRDERSSV